MLRQCWHAVLVVAVLLAAALGNWNDTPTGIDLNKLRRFPLAKLRSGWLKAGSRITFDGITATGASRDAPEVVLRGAGKSGKPWDAHIFGLDEVWRADLDGNGTQDYVFFGSGPYFNGRTTPLFSISILLMDREGLPVPFFAEVYRGENGEGIKHLVDLNHDGRAELLISDYDENPSDARVGPFCSGHWTHQLYRFKDLGVEEIRGTIGGITFPFVHDWTYRGTECEELEPSLWAAIRPAALPVHETSTQGNSTTISRKPRDERGLLAIEPVAGCAAIAPRVIVYDRSQIREIGFPNQFGTYTADLADTIQRDGARVELRGIGRWMGHGDCSINLMWAK